MSSTGCFTNLGLLFQEKRDPILSDYCISCLTVFIYPNRSHNGVFCYRGRISIMKWAGFVLVSPMLPDGTLVLQYSVVHRYIYIYFTLYIGVHKYMCKILTFFRPNADFFSKLGSNRYKRKDYFVS